MLGKGPFRIRAKLRKLRQMKRRYLGECLSIAYFLYRAVKDQRKNLKSTSQVWKLIVFCSYNHLICALDSCFIWFFFCFFFHVYDMSHNERGNLWPLVHWVKLTRQNKKSKQNNQSIKQTKHAQREPAKNFFLVENVKSLYLYFLIKLRFIQTLRVVV